jgi:hypothetical protein
VFHQMVHASQRQIVRLAAVLQCAMPRPTNLLPELYDSFIHCNWPV